MAFSTALLTTVAQCDALNTHGQAEIRAAEYQISLLTYSQENATLNAAEYNDELTGLNDDITSLTTRLATMTDGPFKEKKANELRRATDRRDELNARQQAQGAVAVIKRELDLQQAQAALDLATAMVAAVQARRAEL